MFQYTSLVLVFAFGAVFQLSSGTQVNVTKDDKLCLYANLMLNFSVSYEATDNKTHTVMFALPEEVASTGSSCNANSSTMKLDFGDGHSLSMDFSVSGNNYQADLITFSYNLNDSTVFINSASDETMTVKVNPNIADVAMDTGYSCSSKDVVQVDPVNMTLWNVHIQAFVVNGSISANITTCAADTPTTTPTPPTTPTTVAPVTNTTTQTTTPTPTLPTPTANSYNVTMVNATSPCLLAHFGLRLGYTQGGKYQEMNFDPKGASATGDCGANISSLQLVSDSMTLTFTFTNDTKKFHLHALNVTVKSGSAVVFSDGNTSLALWEAAVGNSYMCNKEQNFSITDQLTLFTFELHVQPFDVKKGVYSTAEECFLDSDLSFLVPIAVGVALSFLIILVLISYLIGRRKSRTGYQSV